MSTKIVELVTNCYKIPLREPVVDSSHGLHEFFELVTVSIITEDGIKGHGYTYTGGCGGKAIWQLIESYLKKKLIGQDSECTLRIWNDLYKQTHYTGRGGIDSFAISAIDIALWDVKCKRANMPLWKMIGGISNCTNVYLGGIDLGFDLEKLLNGISKSLDAGFNAVKIKVGKENIMEDVERVEAVRELIGPDRILMVDANYKWTVPEACKAMKLFEKSDVYWMEEPISPDDIEGYKYLGNNTKIPIASGENYHTVYEFEHMLNYGICNYPQPDPSNIGGITGWLKISELAFAKGLPICSHGMHELSVSLMSGMNQGGYLEVHSFFIDDYAKHQLVIKDGKAYAPNTPGIGVELDFEKLEKYKEC